MPTRPGVPQVMPAGVGHSGSLAGVQPDQNVRVLDGMSGVGEYELWMLAPETQENLHGVVGLKGRVNPPPR